MQVDGQFDAEGRALLSRIQRRHATITEQLHIGHLEIQFTRISDPNRVLDEVAEAEDLRDRLEGKRRENPLHLPYWAELWDSALGVTRFLIQSGLSTQHSALSVLDLGCGMGLCGTVAAAMGWNVLFADLEPEALLFARLNSLPYRTHVRTRQLNWKTDRLDERFDLILGADILYERSQWEFLERFWLEHLKQEGTILLGEPGRQTGTIFLDWIDRSKWTLEQFAQPVETRSTPIRIFKLTRKKYG